MRSIKKLISFNNNKARDKRDSGVHESLEARLAIEEELKQLQKLIEMRNQYEGLCAVSSLVANRALDFSAAVQELATYFINTFGSIEDGELSKVFKIVGRVQFEISKILDLYAAHVTQTITEPTEILLTQLRNIQDAKQQHDEKRQLYEQLSSRVAKSRPKAGKGEAFADQQLQDVKDEFDRLSCHVNTRFFSLEQGQARCLITQAARHHSAQMHLFSRGHSSLQAVEPYMRQVSRERHIDRQLSMGINGAHEIDDDSDTKSDVSYFDEHDDLSNPQSLEQSSRWDPHLQTPGRSPTNEDEEAEVPKDLSKAWSSLLSKSNRRSGENPPLRTVDISGSASSQSSMQEQSGVLNQLQGRPGRSVPHSPRVRPFEQDTIQVTEVHDESKSPELFNHPSPPPSRPPPDIPAGTTRGYDGVGFIIGTGDLSSQSVSTSGRTSVDRRSSSDADQVMNGMISDSSGVSLKFGHNSLSSSEPFHAKFSAPAQRLPEPKLQKNSVIEKPPVVSFVSPALSSTPVRFTSNSVDAGRLGRRYSQSGPLTFNGTPWSSQPPAGSMTPTHHSLGLSDTYKSGPLGRSPLGRTFGSPRISPTMSPPRMSPPRISELHKLPPPPLNPIKTKAPRSPPIIAHSAPLSKLQDPLRDSLVHATPLPPPPLGSVPRSLSLPSRQKQHRSKAPSIAQVPEVNEEESPTSLHVLSASISRTPTRANVQSVHKRESSVNIPGAETGIPPSDVKFVHFNAARSASGTPTLSSQHLKPPSPSARGGKEKAQQLDGRRADSMSHSPFPLKVGGAPNPSRWRSLSINDKDSYSYIHNIARAVAMQREFQPEMVSLNPT